MQRKRPRRASTWNFHIFVDQRRPWEKTTAGRLPPVSSTYSSAPLTTMWMDLLGYLPEEQMLLGKHTPLVVEKALFRRHLDAPTGWFPGRSPGSLRWRQRSGHQWRPARR